MDFVERRIEQAQRAGFFDDLALRGQPIPDLDEERPPGWWAESSVARDHALRRLHRLLAQLPRRKGIIMLDDDPSTSKANCRHGEPDDVASAGVGTSPTDRRYRLLLLRWP